jgi:hypothetical protein
MSKWPMRGHFRYLRFNTFPITPRTPQCEVFWAFLSSSEHLGVPEDSKSQLFRMLGFTPTLGQSRVATNTQDSPQPRLWGSHHLPPYNILYGWPWSLHPNGFSLPGLSSESPEIMPTGTPANLEPHNFISKPRIEVRSKAKL